jgi:hypothetical protein
MTENSFEMDLSNSAYRNMPMFSDEASSDFQKDSENDQSFDEFIRIITTERNSGEDTISHHTHNEISANIEKLQSESFATKEGIYTLKESCRLQEFKISDSSSMQKESFDYKLPSNHSNERSKTDKIEKKPLDRKRNGRAVKAILGRPPKNLDKTNEELIELIMDILEPILEIIEKHLQGKFSFNHFYPKFVDRMKF